MCDLEHARLMLRLSRDELAALEAMSESPLFTTGIFGFHAQQSVEKGLKSWLSLIGIEYPITHSLTVLLNLLEENGIQRVEEFRALSRLTPFAVQFRYEEYESLVEVFDRSDIVEEIRVFLDCVSDAIQKRSSREDGRGGGNSRTEPTTSE